MPHMDEWEYTGVFNADLAHTEDAPFCNDSSCPCKENTFSTNEVGGYVSDGLMTADEADRLYRGGTV